MGKPQFSIRLLLLTVAAVAVVLALMLLRVPTDTAFLSFAGIIIVATALSLVGLGGPPGVRAFCTGALVPLSLMLFYIVQQGGLIQIAF